MSGKSGTADDVPAGELVGAAIDRREDSPLVTGEAAYTDDISLPGMVHLALVRSRYAHAHIHDIDTSTAETLDGVIAVYTAGDLRESGVGTHPTDHSGDRPTPDHPVLASETVRYQGEPIAAVVAETRYAARDGRESVEVEYDRLDAVTTLTEACETDAPTLHDGASDNVAFEWEHGDETAVDEAFTSAPVTVDVELVNNRVIPTPMEPRAAVASFSPSDNRLTVSASNQSPHRVQRQLAETLGVPDQNIHVTAPDVGGGFGAKLQPYSGYTLAAWCAMQLHRPVKWQATRTEEFVSAVHARGHTTTAAIALTENGDILALRVRTHADVGSYLTLHGASVPTTSYGRMLPGQYDVPSAHVRVSGVFTNTTPVSAYRGAGRPEACYVIERLMHAAAEELDVDPSELRRRNLIPPESFPYESVLGHVYDSGDYETSLDRALEAIEYETARDRQTELRERDRYLGIGISCYVEACGAGPDRFESAAVRIKPSGTVIARVGTMENGQGHGTSFAQIISDALGVSYENVSVVEGDTAQVPEGNGTAGSRGAPVGGSAVAKSAAKVREQARRIAAHHLEAAIDDIEFAGGTFTVAGAPTRSISIEEVATRAYAGDVPEGEDPGLEATAYYLPSNYTFPFGTHIAVVEVDPESGEIEFEQYVGVDDVGTQINPKIVEGQLHGGVAQGVGQALYERAAYDDSDNLITSSLQEYALPTAEHVPEIELESTVTECPHNPLGVKGVGEAGTIAAPPAVVNAVIDALAPFGVDAIDMPITPETVWRAVRENTES